MEHPYDIVIVPGVPLENGKWSYTMKQRVCWSKYLYDRGITKNVIYQGLLFIPHTVKLRSWHFMRRNWAYRPAISSTKSMTGHEMWMAGASDSIFFNYDAKFIYCTKY